MAKTTNRTGILLVCASILAGPLFSIPVSSQTAKPEKSPRQAFLRSLIVPGWGEFYSGAKYRAAGFFAAEALTWIAWANWRSSGADQRDVFRRFADQNWNEQRYREWQQYNAQTGSRYIETETLPTKAEDIQQYYELIGKYAQFIYGWDDVTDPLSVNNQQINSSLQQQYETMRNDSNQDLKRASVVIGLTVVNHVISAIHASAYTKKKWSPESKRVWVGLAPVSPTGREGLTALMSVRF